MGINPAHFNQGYGDNIFPVKSNRCQDLWPQESWMYSDHVSREDLAREIDSVERAIANVVNFFPAPKWIAQEVHQFPRHHRRDVWRYGATDVRNAHVSIPLNYGKFVEAGQRATTLLDTAATGVELVYDFAALTATITIPDPSVSDLCEVKVYTTGKSGAQEWEIRSAKSKTITGGNLVLVFDSWLFIKPTLWDAYPTQTDFAGIDVTAAANHVTSVEIYREYNDPTATSAVLYWEPRPKFRVGFCPDCSSSDGTCETCQLTTQNGCCFPHDVELGTVAAVPATYDADNAEWTQNTYSVCRDPDMVKFYYYAGALDNRWLRGTTCDPLPEDWARVIARMATARLERPFCHCSHVTALGRDLRVDLAFSGDGGTFFLRQEEAGNPFGTRRGEIEAWRFVMKIKKRRLVGGTF
jgi:hypothetical protein